MESIGDKTRAVIFALLVHLICFAFLFFGLLWSRTAQPISIPGAVIEATLVGPASVPKPRVAAKPKPAPPKPEPPAPPPEPPAPPPQRNDAIDREKIAEISDLKAKKAEREQEEKIRQQQIRLDDEQKREAIERQKQLDDIKKQHEVAQKKLKLEQEKLAQLNDLQKQQTKPVKAPPAQLPESEQPHTGMAGQDDSLSAQYYAAIQNAVTQNWLRPDNTPVGLRCTLRIVQIPGGDVLSVDIASPCNADAQTRTSIEQAVKRAAPLPYKGYEKVFQRTINFNFTYDG
ncbi:MAG TPA: cell envelope integrity protein TolA [Rudaea sp.]|jgi:colicin import membrane protein